MPPCADRFLDSMLYPQFHELFRRSTYAFLARNRRKSHLPGGLCYNYPGRPPPAITPLGGIHSITKEDAPGGRHKCSNAEVM
jgi:hypothetical protein